MRLRRLGGQDQPGNDPEAGDAAPPAVDLDTADPEETEQPAIRPQSTGTSDYGSGKEDPMAREIDRTIDGNAKIKVVGAGGAGGNAVNRMIRSKLRGVEFVPVNTYLRALHTSASHVQLNIGKKLTRGLGSGGDPNKGQEAAEESRQ